MQTHTQTKNLGVELRNKGRDDLASQLQKVTVELESKDRNGKSVAGHLLELIRQPGGTRHAEAIINALQTYGMGTQGEHGACAAETASYLLDSMKVGEWVRIARELLTQDRATLYGPDGKKHVMTAPPDSDANYRMDDNGNRHQDTRSTIDKLMQSAILNLVAPKGSSYFNVRDKFLLPDGRVHPQGSGATDEQMSRALTLLTGEKHLALDPTLLKKDQESANLVIESLRCTGNAQPQPQPVYASLNWPDEGEHGAHAVAITRVERNRVYFRNPWGSTTDQVGTQLDKPPRITEDNHTGLESMSIKDFKANLLGIVITESRLDDIRRAKGLADYNLPTRTWSEFINQHRLKIGAAVIFGLALTRDSFFNAAAMLWEPFIPAAAETKPGERIAVATDWWNEARDESYKPAVEGWKEFPGLLRPAVVSEFRCELDALKEVGIPIANPGEITTHQELRQFIQGVIDAEKRALSEGKPTPAVKTDQLTAEYIDWSKCIQLREKLLTMRDSSLTSETSDWAPWRNGYKDHWKAIELYRHQYSKKPYDGFKAIGEDGKDKLVRYLYTNGLIGTRSPSHLSTLDIYLAVQGRLLRWVHEGYPPYKVELARNFLNRFEFDCEKFVRDLR